MSFLHFLSLEGDFDLGDITCIGHKAIKIIFQISHLYLRKKSSGGVEYAHTQ